MRRLILAAAMLAATGSWAVAQDVVRMGTEGAYPPWNYVDDKGQIAGFERELGDALCKRADLKCTWVTNDWDSIIPNLVSGNYDTIIAGMSITPERQKLISFTENYTPPDPSSYLVLASNKGLDLSKAVVAAQTNTIQAAFVAEKGWKLIEYATGEEGVAAVRNGEADAMLLDKSFLQPIADQDPDLALLDREEIIGKGVGMGIRKSDPALRDKFNKAIHAMKCDGSLNALIDKWKVASDFGHC